MIFYINQVCCKECDKKLVPEYINLILIDNINKKADRHTIVLQGIEGLKHKDDFSFPPFHLNFYREHFPIYSSFKKWQEIQELFVPIKELKIIDCEDCEEYYKTIFEKRKKALEAIYKLKNQKRNYDVKW
jgi:hypothetical protein